MLPWMATGAVPVRIRTATHFSLENSHRETSHRGRTFRSPWAFVRFTTTLRYEPCPQFINVSQRALHIYWQFSAMSHAIHKIVSKNAANRISLRGVRRIGKSKDSDLCASAHRCPHYAYARLIARVTLQNEIRSATLMINFLFSFVVSPHTFWYRPPGSHRPWNGACYGSIRNSP